MSASIRALPVIAGELISGPIGLVADVALLAYGGYKLAKSIFSKDEDIENPKKILDILKYTDTKVQQQKLQEYLKTLKTDEEKEKFIESFNRLKGYIFKFITRADVLREIYSYNSILKYAKSSSSSPTIKTALEDKKRRIIEKFKQFIGEDKYKKYFESQNISSDELFNIINRYAMKYLPYKNVYDRYIANVNKAKQLIEKYKSIKDNSQEKKKLLAEIHKTKIDLEKSRAELEQHKTPLIQDIIKFAEIKAEKDIEKDNTIFQEIQKIMTQSISQQGNKPTELKASQTQNATNQNPTVIINSNNSTNINNQTANSHNETLIEWLFNQSLDFMTSLPSFYLGTD